MVLQQLESMSKVLSFTGNKVVSNGKEVDEPRAVKPKESALRSSIMTKIREASQSTRDDIEAQKEIFKKSPEKVDEVNAELDKLLKVQIPVELTKEEEEFIKACVDSYAGFTPDMDSFAALYA